MFGEAHPDDRRDDGWPRGGGLSRRPHRDLMPEPRVGFDRQVRPVLLDRGDGDDDDGVLGREGAKILRLQFAPFDFHEGSPVGIEAAAG